MGLSYIQSPTNLIIQNVFENIICILPGVFSFLFLSWKVQKISGLSIDKEERTDIHCKQLPLSKLGLRVTTTHDRTMQSYILKKVGKFKGDKIQFESTSMSV